MHEAASQGLGCRKQLKTGLRRGLPFHAGMKMVVWSAAGNCPQKVHQQVGGTGSDQWRGNDRERRRRFGRGLGEGQGLNDGLR
jgi:hypothetical protein